MGWDLRRPRDTMTDDREAPVAAVAQPAVFSQASRLERRRVGEVLIDAGVLNGEQLEAALQQQRRTTGPRRRLGEVITDMGLANEVDIAQALSDQLNLPFVDLSTLTVGEAVIATLPRQVATRHRIVPITLAHDVLTVAMADPTNVLALDDVRAATKIRRVRAAVATDSDLVAAVDRYYGSGATSRAIDSFNELQAEVQTDLVGNDDVSALREASDTAPVVRLVNAIFAEALQSRASDIHLEPRAGDLRVRLRIDGLLREVSVVPKQAQGALISRVKIISGMDIAERRKPQDGRGRIKLDNQEADTRVSAMPTMHGETIVIRLLRKGAARAKSLSETGLEGGDLDMVRQGIESPQGLILITGPTGSGKTSTLYAAITDLLRPDINIVTLEDPVEYEMGGINQTQINERVGLSFATGLRTILRQDPDVVLVGEVRDPETASIALQASMTGHLVLSTLHTNDAPSAPTRLVDMGVEPFLITSSLTMVVAQRLVRVPCSRCSAPMEADAKTLELLGLSAADIEHGNLVLGKGCETCARTGYTGRLAVFEVMPMDRDVRDLVAARAPERLIREAAIRLGMRSLRQDALSKALAGRTTLAEVLRATPAGADHLRKAEPELPAVAISAPAA